MNKLICPFLISLSMVLGGCGGGDNTVETPEVTRNGRFVVEVTDAPVDNAAAVVIEYTGVEIKPESGAAVSFDFDTPKRLDLISVTESGFPAELLNFARLPLCLPVYASSAILKEDAKIDRLPKYEAMKKVFIRGRAAFTNS